MRCPSCGNQIDADERFAKLVVCDACHASIVLDAKAARLAGKMAVLAETPSPLYLNATGKLSGRRWTVLGRVRYGYDRGYWDEWYLRFDDGKTAWFSEDEGNLTLEVQEDIEPNAVDFATVTPGDTLHVGGFDYHVDEKDVARCEGGAGQLPFVIEQGERVPYLDISAGERFSTLEFDADDNQARLFHGRRIDPNDLEVDYPREMVGATGLPTGERSATPGTRERVVRSDDRAKALNCNCCGAPLAIPPGGTDSVTCDHCGTSVDTSVRRVTCQSCGIAVPIYGGREADTFICPKCHGQHDIRGTEPTLLQIIAQANRPKVPFHMGQRGTLRGLDVVIVGHLRFLERDEGISYISDEFLLHCPKVGYRWLVVENGHFSLTDELDERPIGVDAKHIPPGHRFNFNGIKYRVFERGRCEIVWVDGELPWVAEVGDANHYMDATAPPTLLTAEWTQVEQEWYRAFYLTREEVAAGFGIKTGDLPNAKGIAPHQPFERSPFRKQAMTMMLAAGLIFGALAICTAMIGGHEIGRMTVQASDYAEEFVTDTFTTTEPNVLCSARFEAPVNNDWVYLDVAVLNEQDEALFDFSAQISYYHGVEGGESWSEGSTNDSAVFRIDEPGTYRFLLLGQAGTGDDGSYTAGYGRPVTITVNEGVVLARYYFVLMVICLSWWVVEWIAEANFQSRKWKESDVEND